MIDLNTTEIRQYIFNLLRQLLSKAKHGFFFAFSSSGGRTWTKVKEAIRKTSERESPIIKVARDSESSIASSYDNILSDPYAELEGQNEHHLSTDMLSSVKRSSSTGQVIEPKFQPKFVQRRHSLTSISDDCSPVESKKQKTPWKMVS